MHARAGLGTRVRHRGRARRSSLGRRESSASPWCCAPRPQRTVPRPGRRGSASPRSPASRSSARSSGSAYGSRADGGPRRATAADAQRWPYVAEAAYAPYLPRMDGARPGPMDTDYAAAVRDTEAWVALTDGEVVGPSCCCVDEGDAMLLENVAVLPSHHGQGVGRALLELAEERAVAAGRSRIRLYTHEIDGREPAALRADRLRRDAPGRRARVHAGSSHQKSLRPGDVSGHG